MIEVDAEVAVVVNIQTVFVVGVLEEILVVGVVVVGKVVG